MLRFPQKLLTAPSQKCAGLNVAQGTLNVSSWIIIESFSLVQTYSFFWFQTLQLPFNTHAQKLGRLGSILCAKCGTSYAVLFESWNSLLLDDVVEGFAQLAVAATPFLRRCFREDSETERSCRARGNKRITKLNHDRGPQTDRTGIPHCLFDEDWLFHHLRDPFFEGSVKLGPAESLSTSPHSSLVRRCPREIFPRGAFVTIRPRTGCRHHA